MANFLINSPSSETVGTNSNDLFVLQAIQGVSVFGLEGNDTFSAVGLAGSAALLNAGAGNDAITLTASTSGSLFKGSVFAGAGNDVITAAQDFSAAVLRGGSGNDTIVLKADAGNAIDKSTINGNDNSDLIQGTVIVDSESSLIAAGKGKDTIDLRFSGANAFTINGGAGHDSITLSADAKLSAFVVAGGDGFDTIIFEAGAAAQISGNSNIDGGALNDLIEFDAAVATTVGSATIAGGDGADTIRFTAGADILGGFINAGAGNDSVYIRNIFNAGSLNGGDGQDSLTIGTFNESGAGVIIGGLGADSISLGDKGSIAVGTGGYAGTTGGSTLGYASFDQSNLAAYDKVSAGVTFTDNTSGAAQGLQNLFNIRQDVVDGTVASSIAGLSTFGTDGAGVATFTSTFSNLVTARVEELDRVLGAGQSVLFQNGAGTETFVFMQGGTAGSGTDNDLLVRTNVSANKLNAGSVSSLSVQFTANFT